MFCEVCKCKLPIAHKDMHIFYFVVRVLLYMFVIDIPVGAMHVETNILKYVKEYSFSAHNCIFGLYLRNIISTMTLFAIFEKMAGITS